MVRKLISHSEVEALGQCEQKHRYAHVDKLTAIRHSAGLSVGTDGHKAFETFFKALLDTKGDEAIAKAQAMSVAAGLDNGPVVLKLFVEWVDKVWPTLGWKVVACEVELRVAISPTLVYPCKIDLLVEINGDLVLVDHKFLYDFYTQQMVDIFPQMPKYIAALRNNGYPVKYAIYNMVRTRKVTKFEDRYERLETHPSSDRLKISMGEQIEGMQRIERGIPVTIRSANKMNCGNCQFASLCAAELRGENTKLMRENFFEPNTYGYEDI